MLQHKDHRKLGGKIEAISNIHMHNYLRFESRILKPGDGHSGSKRLTLADDIFISVNLGFGREAAENCALLGHYAASSDNFLQRFWVNLSVPSSGFKN